MPESDTTLELAGFIEAHIDDGRIVSWFGYIGLLIYLLLFVPDSIGQPI